MQRLRDAFTIKATFTSPQLGEECLPQWAEGVSVVFPLMNRQVGVFRDLFLFIPRENYAHGLAFQINTAQVFFADERRKKIVSQK